VESCQVAIIISSFNTANKIGFDWYGGGRVSYLRIVVTGSFSFPASHDTKKEIELEEERRDDGRVGGMEKKKKQL
jgi:hypothetical protein